MARKDVAAGRSGARWQPADGRWWRLGRGWTVTAALGIAMVAALFAGVRHLVWDDAARLQSRAETLAGERNWLGALEIWRAINATSRATWRTHLGEGKACLGLGKAAQAERALRRAIAARPSEPEASLLLLEIFRVEDRPLEAFSVAWEVFDLLAPEARPELLRELTLCALADLPDDLARTTLERWLKADPEDVDARVAYLRRVAAEPRSSDPDREVRLAELTGLVQRHPEHVGAREALVTALADAGEPEQAGQFLDHWPEAGRDGRFWRLKGRWELEHNRRPDLAAAAFETALRDFPQDWRTHYRLARALQNGGQPEQARREAIAVSRIRELLDPMVLLPKLDAAFGHLDDPAAPKTLAELCERAGLTRLAEAWRSAGNLAAERQTAEQRPREARRAESSSPGPFRGSGPP